MKVKANDLRCMACETTRELWSGEYQVGEKLAHLNLIKRYVESCITDLMEKNMISKKAFIGAQVLYCKYGTPGGEHLPEPSPAIVTKVLNEETQECQLFVMNPNGIYFNPTKYSEEMKPGHWSWSKE